MCFTKTTKTILFLFVVTIRSLCILFYIVSFIQFITNRLEGCEWIREEDVDCKDFNIVENYDEQTTNHRPCVRSFFGEYVCTDYSDNYITFSIVNIEGVVEVIDKQFEELDDGVSAIHYYFKDNRTCDIGFGTVCHIKYFYPFLVLIISWAISSFLYDKHIEKIYSKIVSRMGRRLPEYLMD